MDDELCEGYSYDIKIHNNFFNNTENLFSENHKNRGLRYDHGGNLYSPSMSIKKTAGKNIVGGPYLGGNYWVNPNGTGFSQTCSDEDIDGICDTGLGEGINDWRPLTEFEFSYSNPPIHMTTITSNQYQPRWSPKGKKIVYVSDETGNPDIWVMNEDGTEKTQLTTNEWAQYDPAWSPSGERIAFVSEETGNPEIWVMNNNGSDKVRLTNNEYLDQEPCWDNYITYTSNQSGNLDIWFMKSDGTNQRQLTNEPSNQYSCSWSHMGLLAYISEKDGSPKIWITSYKEEGDKKQLTNENSSNFHPSWTPTNRNIVFMSEDSGTQNIFIKGVHISSYHNRLYNRYFSIG